MPSPSVSTISGLELTKIVLYSPPITCFTEISQPKYSKPSVKLSSSVSESLIEVPSEHSPTHSVKLNPSARPSPSVSYLVGSAPLRGPLPSKKSISPSLSKSSLKPYEKFSSTTPFPSYLHLTAQCSSSVT
ncbi:MAG: hypothetical protein ACTSRP_20750 [Candidatus Helarchaeota archaeon]